MTSNFAVVFIVCPPDREEAYWSAMKWFSDELRDYLAASEVTESLPSI